MLFNDKLLFLHVPKAAGTSVTSFLIRNLRGPVTITEPAYGAERLLDLSTAARLRLGLRRLRRQLGLLARPSLAVVAGSRHENLREARALLDRMGRRLGGFEMILAIIRNPYDLEVSRFHFFRRGHFGIKGLAGERAEELALAGDFAEFAKQAPYHGCLPGRMEDWFEIEGRIPQNLHVLRFENIEQDLNALISSISPLRSPLPKLNATVHAPYTCYLTPEIEDAIYRKFRWPFDRGYYRREIPWPRGSAIAGGRSIE